MSPLKLIEEFAPVATQNEFGELVGVSARTVRELTERGAVVVTERGKVETIKSLHGYIGRLRDQARGRHDVDDSRKKLDTFKAYREELAYKKELGEALDLSEVKEAWARFAVVLRTSAMALPSRARARIPHLTAHDSLTLDALVREFLVDLSKELESGTVQGAESESLSVDDAE